MGGTAAEKRCTPTFNGLSDSGVRRDYMAVACAYLPHDAVVIFVVGVFFFGVADFFSAKRLFLRAARDVSGERSAPPWARVVIKRRKLVFGFIPIRLLTIGL